MMNVYLSVILPVHNELDRLAPGLVRLYKYLDRCLFSYEVIVVENGSTDGTQEILDNDFFRQFESLHHVHLPVAGKGAAVRCGMLNATGHWRLMADIDWSMDPAEIHDLMAMPGDMEFDIAIASREHYGSRRIGEPFNRHLSGRVFNLLVRLVTRMPFTDTQCGYKLFTAQAAEDIFYRSHCDGWAFDVELLYIALLRMYTIKETPITWTYNGNSRVKLLADSWQMFKDVLNLKRYLDRSTIQPLERFA